MMMFPRRNLLLVIPLALLPLISASRELRGAPPLLEQHDQGHRALEDWFTDTVNWIFGGNADNNTDTTSDSDGTSDWLSDTLNSIFGSGSNEDGTGDTTMNDVLGIIEGIFGGASDGTQGSDNPIMDLLNSLLNQQGGEMPLQELLAFFASLLNQQDGDMSLEALVNGMTSLFNSTTSLTSVEGFVRDIVDGTSFPLQMIMNEWLDAEALVVTDLNCSASDSTTSANDVPTTPKQGDRIPSCAYNFYGDEGVWICRTFYNPINGKPSSETHCANPQLTFAQTDKCGSCDNTYPTPCSCKCDRDGTNDGVLVSLTNTFGQKEEQCVHAGWALGAADRYEITCSQC